MVLFLDTAFVLSLILETEKTGISRRYFNEATESRVTSISVYEEAFYVGIRILAEERLNIKGKYDLRDYIKKKGYEFAKDFVEKLHKLFTGDYISLVADTKGVDSIREMAEKYRLLPSDALIAATCRHHNIKRIITFDSDFDRVDFLEVVTPE